MLTVVEGSTPPTPREQRARSLEPQPKAALDAVASPSMARLLTAVAGRKTPTSTCGQWKEQGGGQPSTPQAAREDMNETTSNNTAEGSGVF